MKGNQATESAWREEEELARGMSLPVAGNVVFVAAQGTTDPDGRTDSGRASGIIEIAMSIIAMVQMEILEFLHCVVRPGGPISNYEALHVHGMRASRMPGAVGYSAALRAIREKCVAHDVRIIGRHPEIEKMSRLLQLPQATYCDLQLPPWKDRMGQAYSQKHAALWSSVQQSLLRGHHLRHRSFIRMSNPRPSQRYRQQYGYRCAIKDVLYYILAAAMGVPLQRWEGSTPVTLMAACVQADAFELEGVELSDPGLPPRMIKILEQYLDKLRREGDCRPPVFAPLFGGEVESDEKEALLSGLFVAAVQRIARRTAVGSISPFAVLRAARELGEANFCSVPVLPADCLPRCVVLLVTTSEGLQMPPHVSVWVVSRRREDLSVALREARASHPAKYQLRLVLDNIIRSSQVTVIKSILREVRALFCVTPVAVTVHNNWTVKRRIEAFQRRLRVEAHVYSPQSPQSLWDSLPALFRNIY